MSSLGKVTIILGTRPEAIKLAPVILAFKSCKSIRTRVVLSGQHKDMVKPVIELFGIHEDNDLEIMSPNQSLNLITSKTITGITKDFNFFRPNLVLVQGDTTTAFAGALAAFNENIPIGHVEAGLRSNNLLNPFPEEANRRLISQIASLHFAPTPRAENNLNDEKVLGKIYMTGNSIIDALNFISKRKDSLNIKGLTFTTHKVILVTVHRRENWGENLKNILNAILKILSIKSDVAILLPLHKNSLIREPIKKMLSNHPRVFLTEPLNYEQLIIAIKGSYLLLTDSGGLQEEAPSFGKPVLILRENTERPEAIEAGTAKLIGTKEKTIIDETLILLNNKIKYESMAKAINPFGDGKTSMRILSACIENLKDFPKAPN